MAVMAFGTHFTVFQQGQTLQAHACRRFYFADGNDGKPFEPARQDRGNLPFSDGLRSCRNGAIPWMSHQAGSTNINRLADPGRWHYGCSHIVPVVVAGCRKTVYFQARAPF